MIPTKKLGDGDSSQQLYGVTSRKLSYNHLTGLYRWTRMDHQPSLSAPNGYGDPTGTTGDKNRAFYKNGLSSQYHVKGTQSLLGPLLDVDKGLDISQDQTDNDGVEHVFGALGLISPFLWDAATSYAFLRIKFRIADVSGTDDCNVGIRKNEAFQGNVDDYADAFWVNINLGDILVENMVGGATTVTTDTTQNWADDATHDIKVVLAAGKCGAFLDGVPLTGFPAYTFTSTLKLVPFFFFLQATTSPGKVWWTEVEVGVTSETTSSGLSGI